MFTHRFTGAEAAQKGREREKEGDQVKFLHIVASKICSYINSNADLIPLSFPFNSIEGHNSYLLKEHSHWYPSVSTAEGEEDGRLPPSSSCSVSHLQCGVPLLRTGGHPCGESLQVLHLESHLWWHLSTRGQATGEHFSWIFLLLRALISFIPSSFHNRICFTGNAAQ